MSKHPDDEIVIEHREFMNNLAYGLDKHLNGDKRPKKYGFMLAVFDFGDRGRFNYIGNSNREELVTLMKEMIARFEGQPEVSGRA
jgi:hypothetical protein